MPNTIEKNLLQKVKPVFSRSLPPTSRCHHGMTARELTNLWK